jgi:pyruvyltransferase
MEIFKSYARGALRAVRVESKSNLFWWQGPPLNFGDWIGPYLFKSISGIDPVHRQPSNKSFSTVFITVGSCARWFCEDSIVWGAGIIEKDEVFWRPMRTCAVRGNFTRQRMLELGYECPEVYGDPAVLLPDFYNPDVPKQYKFGVVPHYCNFSEAEATFENFDTVNVIDVRTRDVEFIVRELKKCEMILSSSLHGLILGNAYSIPSAQVEFTSKLGGDGVKFLDYFSSFGITPPEPLVIEGPLEASVMEDFVNSYPQPNTETLKQGLYESCPFKPLE